jgi:hypothetical protein
MITAQSSPDYDGWGPDTYWRCNEWIQWHQALKNAYGLTEANTKFITAYHKAGFGAASYDCRTFNQEFRTYARQNGFFDALFEGIGSLMQPVGSVLETGGNVLGTVQSVTEVIRKLTPLLVITAVIILVVFMVKKTNIA